jgi:prevent-host-death family protein
MSRQKSVEVTIPASQVHRNFGELIRRAFAGKEHFIVEKDGLPVVAILSVAEYQNLLDERAGREQDHQRRLREFEAAARSYGEAVAASGITEEELLAEMKQTRKEVYRDQYGDPAE